MHANLKFPSLSIVCASQDFLHEPHENDFADTIDDSLGTKVLRGIVYVRRRKGGFGGSNLWCWSFWFQCRKCITSSIIVPTAASDANTVPAYRGIVKDS